MMGGGRKTKTLPLKEKSQPSWKVNCSASARNLRKSDLGAVIFGCKHSTIKECFSKELFGLPAPHFAYVKNISPGLPLFLFNYSDRKLHGMFEAASPGQMNINPYGWTADGSEYTQYGAQVRVRILMQCQPLAEDQFAPVIADNYYERRLFWFELDHTQTKKLIALFFSSPNAGNPMSASVPRKLARWNTSFRDTQTSETSKVLDDVQASVSWVGSAHSDQFNVQWGSVDAPGVGRELQVLEGCVDVIAGEKCQREPVQPQPNCARSYSSVLDSTSTRLKKWSALFNTSTASDTSKENEDFKTQASEIKLPRSDQFIMEWESAIVAHHVEGESHDFEAQPDASATEFYKELHMGYKSDGELMRFSTSIDANGVFQGSTSYEAILSVDDRLEGEYCQAVTSYGKFPHSDESSIEWGYAVPHVDGETRPSEASTDDHVLEFCKEDELHPETKGEVSNKIFVTEVIDADESHGNKIVFPCTMADLHQANGSSSELEAAVDLKSPDVWSVVAKLVQEIELKHAQKISSLEQELVQLKGEVQQLKNHCHVSECGPHSLIRHAQEKLIDTSDESRLEIQDSILIVGGFDGSSWLSALDCYSPSLDTLKSLKPMSFVRSYASAVALNGELYIFGGVDGDKWHDTVESYKPTHDQWVSRPSLSQKKGSLAGASLHGKIYAVGGGNGVECYSEVEMLEMNIGSWMTTQPMLQKRFAPAAAEINGVLYVAGGYDGRSYLSSVERLDPREPSWTRLGNMSTKRGCHALTVLNEKLYALGGYNGAEMVSTVEIFDPRLGSWMMGEPMNSVRGYSGAAVIGEKIHVIGGVKDNDKILDTIECFKEGGSWEVTNMNAVGRRCFFSAVVL